MCEGCSLAGVGMKLSPIFNSFSSSLFSLYLLRLMMLVDFVKHLAVFVLSEVEALRCTGLYFDLEMLS